MPNTLKQYMFERKEINLATYQPENVRQSFSTEREARKEYSRLRSIAQKRIERLEKVSQEEGYQGREARKVLEEVGSFEKLKDIQGQDVYTQLERVAKFLHSKKSSVSTFREAVTEEYRKALAQPQTQEALAELRRIKNRGYSDDLEEGEFASYPGDLLSDEEDELMSLLEEDEDETTEEEDFDDLAELFDIWDIMRSLNMDTMRYRSGAVATVYQNKGASEAELAAKLKEYIS